MAGVAGVARLPQKSQLCEREQQKEGRGRASGGPPGMPVHIDTVGVSTTASAATPSPLHLISASALLSALLSHLLPSLVNLCYLRLLCVAVCFMYVLA